MEAAIANIEVEAAGGQVVAVIFGQPVADSSQADLIIGPCPAAALEQKTESSRAVNRRECPGFGMSVTPTEAAPHAEITGNLLLDIQAETIFVAVRARQRHVRIDRHGKPGFPLVAHVPATELTHDAH